MTSVFALTTCGLEDVSAAEIARVATIAHVGYRRIAAMTDDLAPLLRLRTVDDLFLDLGTWKDIGRPRAALALLSQAAGKLEVGTAVRTISKARALPSTPSFSVTASFVGKRNYSGEEIRTAVAAGVQQRLGWIHREIDDEADLNLRVFIEHEVAFVGLRANKRPLHERSYKEVHRPGSLKPSIAAAMLALADVRPGMTVLDPCCGAGTIAIEAALGSARTYAGDRDHDAVVAAGVNSLRAGVNLLCARWDVRALPIADASMARVVCNLPWDRQVAVADSLREFHVAACRAIARSVTSDGRIVVLTTNADSLNFPGRERVSTREISLYGQRPVIAVYA